jgi:hypothetical protein
MSVNSKKEAMDSLERAVLAAIGMNIVSQDELVAKVVALQPALAPDIDEQDIKKVIASIEAQRIVVINPGVVIVGGNHKDWLSGERKNSIAWKRWLAYRSLLTHRKIPLTVIDEMSSRSDIILNLMGDPDQEGEWNRRGLVIGDVQSGKTANYLGLFNKAADAGYKVVILFGGHTDKLRKQTQIRVDEGFVGKDSRLLGKGLKALSPDIRIGVGKIGPSAAGFTTASSDFSAHQLQGLNLEIAALNQPVIFVIKKNKKIIDNLVAWLKSQVGAGEKLPMPMLLLDDEADYASINTNRPDDDPTAINQGIRDLLASFQKNTYVGFTATPFANVLIDEEQELDLFPRDFIYALEAPNNYFGPEKMFSESDDGDALFLRPIYDAEDHVPFKHKSNHEIASIPDTLKEAIRAFFLANAIRDLRGDFSAPRSMLVNVSRFNLVQESIETHLKDYVSLLRDSVIFNGSKPDSNWDDLESTWHSEFEGGADTWPEVANVLPQAASDIVIKVVNSKNKTDDWDALYETDHARVIAVGGDVLSRGLTLEGLMVSYFYRRSVAYDTLMQMGRWFGYREGYEDLCRLWIDEEVAQWYRHISDATLELRDDLRTMMVNKRTPKDFGLAVRRHPGSIMTVTALNKARNAQISRKISLRHYLAETPRLPANAEVIHANWLAFAELLESLKKGKFAETKSNSGHAMWREVSPKLVIELLENFVTSDSEMLFTDEVILTHLRTTKAEWMATWDIVLMQGLSPEILPIDGRTEKLVSRSITLNQDTLFVGGTKMRLGGRGDVSQGLTKEQKDYVQAQTEKGKSPSDKDFRAKLERPLLVIYPMWPKIPAAKGKPGGKKVAPNYVVPGTYTEPIIGLALSFPPGKGVESENETVTYLVNTVFARQNRLWEDGTESEDGED